jgi:putative ABC transport system substrate-binding protein
MGPTNSLRSLRLTVSRRILLRASAAAAAAWPLPVWAAPDGIPAVGVLWHAGSAEGEGANYLGLVRGFRDRGYIDRRTIHLLHRFPNEIPDNFRKMAAELVALKVDVLVSIGANAAPYAKNATSAIPIVFALVSDPIGSNLVKSLARPEANITGFSNSARDVIGKRIELFKEMMPDLVQVALLVNADAAVASGYAETLEKSAGELGLKAGIYRWRQPGELKATFADMKSNGVQGILIAPDGLGFTYRHEIATLAILNRLPVSGWSRDIVASGILMSYGADHGAICARVADYVDRLLKGAKPSDLPVEQPAKFELLINSTTAKAIGLRIPESVLSRADEVIE